MANLRHIDAHDPGMWSFEERLKALEQDRRGVDIYTTAQVHQPAIFADADLDFRHIELVKVVEQWMSSSPAMSENLPGRTQPFESGVGKKMAIIGQGRKSKLISYLPSRCLLR